MFPSWLSFIFGLPPLTENKSIDEVLADPKLTGALSEDRAQIRNLPVKVALAMFTNKYFELRYCRPTDSVMMENSNEHLTVSNGTIKVADQRKAKEISGEKDLLLCVDNYVTLMNIMFPGATRENLSGQTHLRSLLEIGHPWQRVLRFVEAVRFARSETIRGFGGPMDLPTLALLTKYIDDPRTKDTYVQPVIVRPQPSPNSLPSRNNKRKQPSASASILSQSEKTKCFDKEYCFHFNKGTCKHQNDHAYNQNKGTLIHKCAICDSALHGLAKCPQR